MNSTLSHDMDRSSVIGNILQLLSDYSWIYNFKVTNLLTDKILETIPVVWIEFLSNLSVESFNDILIHQKSQETEGIPGDVRRFLELYNSSLIAFESSISCQESEDPGDLRGVSPKKIHEIKSFADFIGKLGNID